MQDITGYLPAHAGSGAIHWLDQNWSHSVNGIINKDSC